MKPGGHTQHTVLSLLRRLTMSALHGMARGDVRALGRMLWGIVCLIDDLDEVNPVVGRRMPEDVAIWLKEGDGDGQ